MVQGQDKTRVEARRKRRDQSKDKVKEKEDIEFLCLTSERRNSQLRVPSAVNCPIPASFPLTRQLQIKTHAMARQQA